MKTSTKCKDCKHFSVVEYEWGFDKFCRFYPNSTFSYFLGTSEEQSPLDIPHYCPYIIQPTKDELIKVQKEKVDNLQQIYYNAEKHYKEEFDKLIEMIGK
jgi:hypothetical protein